MNFFLHLAQTSYRDTLVRSFQMAFSLRDVSLAAEGNSQKDSEVICKAV